MEKIAGLAPGPPCEARGVCAPGALILGGRVHLFSQTYGNGPTDAICQAWSDDGVALTRDPSNPGFAPTGAWTAGRVIDAEAFPVGDRLLLCFATRDPAMKIQMLGVAGAPLASDFSRSTWQQLVDGPVLQPALPWERVCIEAPTMVRRGDDLVMFYAGGCTHEPPQVGAATSRDSLTWTRRSAEPFLAHGGPDSWNASESGHPGVTPHSCARRAVSLSRPSKPKLPTDETPASCPAHPLRGRDGACGPAHRPRIRHGRRRQPAPRRVYP